MFKKHLINGPVPTGSLYVSNGEDEQIATLHTTSKRHQEEGELEICNKCVVVLCTISSESWYAMQSLAIPTVHFFIQLKNGSFTTFSFPHVFSYTCL